MATKIAKNAPCPCGSGLKYKRCCGNGHKSEIDDLLFETMQNSLEFDIATKQAAERTLLGLGARRDITAQQRRSVELLSIQLLQKNGDHVAAVERLRDLSLGKPDDTDIEYLAAKSLERLGRSHEAFDIYERVLPVLKEKMGERGYAFALVEYGRACVAVGERGKAIDAWSAAASWLKGRPKEVEHYARALSNIAGEKLHSDNADERAIGEQEMSNASDLKAQVGDIEGLANNYSRLSMHYFRIGRYERSIAFARKELVLARMVGDELGLAQSLGNLAVIYMKALQLTSARSLLTEAREIGERLKQFSVLNMTDVNLTAVSMAGRDAGKAGLKVGPIADCVCESGKTYQDCCGKADFEPTAALPGFSGFSQDAAQLLKDKSSDSAPASWLDHVLRKTDDSLRRMSWSQLIGRDGWYEAYELPDMANLHLNSARALVDKSDEDVGFEASLGACILSVCAAEAFINSVCYFVADAASAEKLEVLPMALPELLLADSSAYQRKTELTMKWDQVGKALCGSSWPPKSTWQDFATLVAIRNELVHFKAIGYEQVIPPPKHNHEMLRKLPSSVELRDVPHSWPMRLLTHSFAQWCVKSVEELMNSLKDEYARGRSP